jgi:hypothetical protein
MGTHIGYIYMYLRAAAHAADPGKKKEVRSAIHNLRRSDGWMFVLAISSGALLMRLFWTGTFRLLDS